MPSTPCQAMSQDHIASPQSPPPQLIANAALSFFATLTITPHPSQSTDEATAATATVVEGTRDAVSTLHMLPSIYVTPPVHLPNEHTHPKATKAAHGQPNGITSVARHSLMLPAAAISQPFPSLLQYVDHDLMQNVAAHDHPPHPNATCPVCFFQWNSPIVTSVGNTSLPMTRPALNASLTSTFLPLLPCGHWIHYRCLIWLATRTSSDRHDKCWVCNTQLFEWDGITALTLAARTGLDMECESFPDSFDTTTHVFLPSTKATYESECTFIESLITQSFFSQLQQPSPHTDQSPDLGRCYYTVLDQLDQMKKPQAKWLTWSTQTAFCYLGCWWQLR